jgi:hypothetical protein
LIVTRPGLVMIGASAAVLVALVAAGHFRASAPPDAMTGSPGQASAGRRLLGAAPEAGGSPVGWIAKPGPSTEGQDRGGRAAVGPGSRGAMPGTASSGAGGSATVFSAGSRPGSFIGTGRGVGAGGTGAIDAQTSVSATTLSTDLSKLAAGSGRSATGQQVLAGTAQNQTTASGSDASQSTNPDDQGPVLSIPFENTTEPEEGDVAPVAEQGITFDGNGATFSTDAQYVIPDAGNITGDSGTISFCVTPQWAGNAQGDASFVNLHTPNVWENRLQITKNGQYLRFLVADNTGQESGAGTVISGWQQGQSHLVTATWGQALTSLYVDGRLVGSQTYQGQLEVNPGTPLYIGSDYAGGISGADSSLSNFQVYNRILPSDEVAMMSANCQ